jgi:hypothetical protein
MLFSPFIYLKYVISRRFGWYVGGPHLFSTDTNAQLYNDNEQGNSPPDELSYEDAMLDAQLRLFMRADFESVSPPNGQYAEVLLLVSQDKKADGSLPMPTSRPSPAPSLQSTSAGLGTSPFPASRPSGGIYTLLTGTALARLLPGGIALALTMMVLGANLPQLLSGEYVHVSPTPITESLPPQAPTANPVAGQPASNEIYVFDRHEVRGMPQRPEASANPINKLPKNSLMTHSK